MGNSRFEVAVAMPFHHLADPLRLLTDQMHGLDVRSDRRGERREVLAFW